jgi:hypothetical protein
MSKIVSKNAGHTALSSWSGYIYQGKIAICHVLKLFLSDKDLSNFSLRLDCIEDFDILKNKKVVSLHQVKGKGSDLFSGYKSAFVDIQGKSKTYKDAKLYFHLAKNLRDKKVTEIEKDYSPVKIYLYSKDKFHSTLDEVDDHIQSLIKDYFIKINTDEYKQQDNYLAQVREKLDELVVNKILFIHQENMNEKGLIYDLALKNPIGFNEFKDILVSNNLADWINSEEYISFLTKYTFNTYLDVFLQEKEISKDIEKRLKKYILHICKMSTLETQNFIKTLIPHKKVSFKGIKDHVGNSIQSDDLRYAFYEMLSCITPELKLKNEHMYWLNKEYNSFYPTAIDKSGDKQKANTCKDIVRNIMDTDVSVGFDFQNLITTELDVTSIFETVNTITNIPSKDAKKVIDANEHEDKRITRWKTVSLISIENAKKKLNND